MLDAVRCSVCINLANLVPDLKAHLLLQHVHSVFLCDICNKIFYTDDDIQLHIEKHVTEKSSLLCMIFDVVW